MNDEKKVLMLRVGGNIRGRERNVCQGPEGLKSPLGSAVICIPTFCQPRVLGQPTASTGAQFDG